MINKSVKTYCGGKPNYILDKQMNNEPVAHFYPEGEGCTVFNSDFVFKYQGTKEPIPLYTHPAKTLTDEEIAKVAKDFYLSEYVPYDFARAILRKAQEK
jgi:hypothetical protein